MRSAFVLFLGLLMPDLASAQDQPTVCALASKTFTPGAVAVEEGIALTCAPDGSWSVAGQSAECLHQGRAYSPGARILAPTGTGEIVQICKEGVWTDQTPAAKAGLVDPKL